MSIINLYWHLFSETWTLTGKPEWLNFVPHDTKLEVNMNGKAILENKKEYRADKTYEFSVNFEQELDGEPIDRTTNFQITVKSWIPELELSVDETTNLIKVKVVDNTGVPSGISYNGYWTKKGNLSVINQEQTKSSKTVKYNLRSNPEYKFIEISDDDVSDADKRIYYMYRQYVPGYTDYKPEYKDGYKYKKAYFNKIKKK